MTATFKRIMKKKIESQLTWDEITKAAHIPLKSWMTGAPVGSPTDEELQKIAPVLNTTFEYLKYGRE